MSEMPYSAMHKPGGLASSQLTGLCASRFPDAPTSGSNTRLPPDKRRIGLLDLPNELLLRIFRMATSCCCSFFPQPRSDYLLHNETLFSPAVPQFTKNRKNLATKRALVLLSRRLKDIAYPFLHEMVHIVSWRQLQAFSDLVKRRALDLDGGLGRTLRTLVITECHPNSYEEYLYAVAGILELCSNIEVLKVDSLASMYHRSQRDSRTPGQIKAAHALWSALPEHIQHLEIPYSRVIPANLSAEDVSAFIMTHSKLSSIYICTTEFEKMDHVPTDLFTQISDLGLGYHGRLLDWNLQNLRSLYLDTFTYRHYGRFKGLFGTQLESVLSVDISTYDEVYESDVAVLFTAFPYMQNLSIPLCPTMSYSYDLDGQGLARWDVEEDILYKHRHEHLTMLEIYFFDEDLDGDEGENSEESGDFDGYDSDDEETLERRRQFVKKAACQFPTSHLTQERFPALRTVRVVQRTGYGKHPSLGLLEEELIERLPDHIDLQVDVFTTQRQCMCARM